MIILITGLTGTGKTTISEEIAPLIDAVVLSSDKIRKEIIQKPTYSKREKELVYDVMSLLAKYLYRAGKNCILDATFFKEKLRREILEKIGAPKSEIKIVECVCPEGVILERLKNRKDTYSDADIAVYYKIKKMYEPIKEDHLTVDTTLDPKHNALLILKKIKGYKASK
jgi:hypothetical protein